MCDGPMHVLCRLATSEDAIVSQMPSSRHFPASCRQQSHAQSVGATSVQPVCISPLLSYVTIRRLAPSPSHQSKELCHVPSKAADGVYRNNKNRSVFPPRGAADGRIRAEEKSWVRGWSSQVRIQILCHSTPHDDISSLASHHHFND